MASFSVLTTFWIIKRSQTKERNKEKQKGKASKVKKIEDSSYSLLSYFWSTSRSSFSTCYIPFQSSGSQESNTSNRVGFGAEMRKIWPSEDNCSRLVQNSHNTFSLCEACAKLVRSLCKACAKLVRNSHNTFSLCKTHTTLTQHFQN